jgi:hypothetical protein
VAGKWFSPGTLVSFTKENDHHDITEILPKVALNTLLSNTVLSLNISRFGDYLHRIYPNELDVKDATNTKKSASYFDLHIEIDNGG